MLLYAVSSASTTTLLDTLVFLPKSTYLYTFFSIQSLKGHIFSQNMTCHIVVLFIFHCVWFVFQMINR